MTPVSWQALVGFLDWAIRFQLGVVVSVRWLFVIGSVPTDFFFIFSNLFAKTPLLIFRVHLALEGTCGA